MAGITHSSFAFTGTGPIDEGNAVALLNDALPQALGAVYRPTRLPRSNKSLSAVVSWLEGEDQLGPNGLIPSDDLVASLVERRETGDDVTLVYLWPDEPSDEDKDLVTKARAEGIRVMSLTDALDDLLWEPEPETPAEPEAEQGPPWDTTDGTTVTEAAEPAAVDAVVQGGASFLVQLEEFIRQTVRDEIARLGTLPPVTSEPVAEPAKPKARAARGASKTSGAKTSGKTAAPKGGTPEEIADGGGTVLSPKSQAGSSDSDSDEDKITYYMDENGRYRLAKSRPRRGDTRVPLTPAEVDDLVARGLVDDK